MADLEGQLNSNFDKNKYFGRDLDKISKKDLIDFYLSQEKMVRNLKDGDGKKEVYRRIYLISQELRKRGINPYTLGINESYKKEEQDGAKSNPEQQSIGQQRETQVNLQTLQTSYELDGEAKKIESMQKTPENMQKAFEIAKEYNGAQKYLIYDVIFKVFIYGNGFSIIGQNSSNWFSNGEIKLNGSDQNTIKKFQEILKDNLSFEELKNTFLFEAVLRKGDLEKQARDISSRKGISLNYSSEIDKNQLVSQIDSDARLSLGDRIILIAYIRGNYNLVQQDANNFRSQFTDRLSQNSGEFRRVTHINLMDKNNLAKYARDPGKLIGDVVANFAQHPIAFFSAIGLIIGKLFGKNITGPNSSFFMKLFAAGTGYGLYETFGLGEVFGNAIEGEYNEDIKNSWAVKFIRKTYGKMEGFTKDMIDKIADWYNYKNISIENGGKKAGLLSYNFKDLYSLIKEKGLKIDIFSSDGKKIEDQEEKKSLLSKIEDLYNRGLNAFGNNKDAFMKAIEGLTISDVIKLIERKLQEQKSSFSKNLDNASKTIDSVKKSWAVEFIKKTYGKMEGFTKDMIDKMINKISDWYNYKDIIIESGGEKINLLSSKFQDLYSLIKEKGLKIDIFSSDGKKIEDQEEKKSLLSKIEDLYNRGLNAFGNNKDAFMKAIEGLSIIKVEKIIFEKEQDNKIKSKKTQNFPKSSVSWSENIQNINEQTEKQKQDQIEKEKQEQDQKILKQKKLELSQFNENTKKENIKFMNYFSENLKTRFEKIYINYKNKIEQTDNIDDLKVIGLDLKVFYAELKKQNNDYDLSKFLKKYTSDTIIDFNDVEEKDLLSIMREFDLKGNDGNDKERKVNSVYISFKNCIRNLFDKVNENLPNDKELVKLYKKYIYFSSIKKLKSLYISHTPDKLYDNDIEKLKDELLNFEDWKKEYEKLTFPGETITNPEKLEESRKTLIINNKKIKEHMFVLIDKSNVDKKTDLKEKLNGKADDYEKIIKETNNLDSLQEKMGFFYGKLEGFLNDKDKKDKCNYNYLESFISNIDEYNLIFNL